MPARRRAAPDTRCPSRSAFTASAMCSPSRACLMTGKRPSRHGVTLTMTEGDLWPDRAQRPGGAADRGADGAPAARSRARRLARSFVRSALRLGPKSGNEPELPPGIDTLATLLRGRGYHVAMKGKWHLSKPVDGERWGPGDPERIERDYGFAEWEPPDAGGDTKAAQLRRRQRRREPARAGTRTTPARWSPGSAAQDLPEPFCLVFSLVNPHDVLGFPDSYAPGGYAVEEFRGLGVPLPPTLDEDLREKPAVQALSKLGMDNYLGPLPDLQAQAGLRRLLRPPAPGRRREDRPPAARARPARGPGLAALAHGRSCAPPTTARWASPTAACARRSSTPTRRRSACRSWSRTRACSRSRARATRWCRCSTSSPPCSASPGPARPAPEPLDGDDLGPAAARRGARRSATRCCSPTTTTRPGTALQDGAGPAQPDPLRARRALEVRRLPRPARQRPARIRAV